jgi:capsular polysaccharide transport system permease protein
MFRDLKTQFNVIGALAIHNLEGRMKTYAYGYVWLFLEPIMYIAILRLARQFFNPLAPPNNMPPLTFYTVGVIPNFLCFGLFNSVGRVVSSRSKLLSFPRVTQFDLAVASGTAQFATYFLLFWIFVLPISIYEGAWPPKNALEVMLTLIGLSIFGAAAGFCLGAAMRVFPPASQFSRYILRPLRFVSGMFFVITMMPTTVWPYLAWNPILHFMEMIREGWFSTYTSPIASPLYVAECTLVVLLLGLSLERFMRRVPYA